MMFLSSQPLKFYPITKIDGTQTTLSEEVEKNPMFQSFSQDTKEVIYNFDHYMVKWSLINVRPKALGWVLYPFTIPILIVGSLAYGLEVAKSASSTIEGKERESFGPRMGTFRWFLSFPFFLCQCIYYWAITSRRAENGTCQNVKKSRQIGKE